MSLSSVIFIVLLVLKLTNQIDWSWFWVTSPLWAWLAVLIVTAVFVAVIKPLSK